MSTHTRIWTHIATRGPVSVQSVNTSHFWHIYAVFGCLAGPLLHILVEEVISFGMSTQTRITFRNEQSVIEPQKHVKHDNFEKLHQITQNHSFWGLGILFHLISPFLKKKIQIAWCYSPVTCTFSEMCPVSTLVKKFSFWHYIPLDNHWIDHSYQFWPPNPCMRLAAVCQKITIYKKTVNHKKTQKVPFDR